MKLLLDTHALLWWLADDPGMSADARDAIADAEGVFVSAATAWEISLKRSLGKLEAPDDLPHQMANHGFTGLPIHLVQALAAGGLPRLHRDPFDRMLVAQAWLEDLVIVTRDPNIPLYDVQVLTI